MSFFSFSVVPLNWFENLKERWLHVCSIENFAITLLRSFYKINLKRRKV
jgi:hypothetical protein